MPPGVDHAFFSPGDRGGARQALARSASATTPCCCSSAASSRSRALDVAVRRPGRAVVRPRRRRARGRRRGRAASTGRAELARVRELVDELGLADRVRFVPPQPHHLLSTYYRAADVCVVPEPLRVVRSGRARGRRVRHAGGGRRVGGLRTLVDHGRTGCLVDSRDPGRLRRPPWRRSSTIRVGAAAMSVAAAAEARSYTWSTTAARLRRLYADLTARSLVECR